MKKLLALLLALTLIVALMAGCASSTNDNQGGGTTGGDTAGDNAEDLAAQFPDKYEWSMGTTYAANDIAAQAYQLFADLVKEKTGGQVVINFFTDSALGGESDTIMAVTAGDIDFAAFGMSIPILYLEQYSFINGLFIMGNQEEMLNVWNSDVFRTCRDKLASDFNIGTLGDAIGYRGMRHYGTNQKFTNVDEFKGTIMRINSNQNWLDTWNAVGATCVSISLGELYTSIQNGTVAAAEGPWTQFTGYALEEVLDYCMETAHVPDCIPVWMNQDLYNSLPENYQQVLLDAWQEAADWINVEGYNAEKAELQKMNDAGCELVEIDRDSFVAAAADYVSSCFDNLWKDSGTTYDEIMAIVKG